MVTIFPTVAPVSKTVNVIKYATIAMFLFKVEGFKARKSGMPVSIATA